MNVQSTLVNMVELVQILLTDLDVVVLWDLEDLHAGKVSEKLFVISFLHSSSQSVSESVSPSVRQSVSPSVRQSIS